MQIVAFAPTAQGSSPYRAWEPMAELQRRGHTVLVRRGENDLRAAARGLDPSLSSCDVVYVSRATSDDAQRLAADLDAAGIALVWDHDDDEIGLARRGRDLFSRSYIAAVRAMLAHVTIATTTNDHLAAVLREAGAPHVVAIPNHVMRHAVNGGRRRHKGIVLGWIAWIDHQADWERLELANVVERLLDAHPDLRVESVGPIDLGLPHQRYHRIATLPYRRLADAIAGFDIGIAPLADRVENRARSDIKLKEYAIAGVPWVASPVGPYIPLGEQQGGRLAADDRWHEELDALLSDPRLRRRLAKQGRRWAKQETLPKHVGAWEAMFAEAIERHAARASGRRRTCA